MTTSQEFATQLDPRIDPRTVRYATKYKEIDKSSDGYWVLDLTDSDYEYLSPGLWEHLGYQPELQHTPGALRTMMHSGDLARLKDLIRGYTEPFTALLRFHRPDHSWAWVSCRCTRLSETELIGTHQDASNVRDRALAIGTGPLKESGEAMREIMSRIMKIAIVD